MFERWRSKKNAESGVQESDDVYLAEELVRVLDTLAVHLLVLSIGLDVGLGALSGVEESGGDGKLDIFFGHCCLQKVGRYKKGLVYEKMMRRRSVRVSISEWIVIITASLVIFSNVDVDAGMSN